jgi:HlyD family secretion protein
MATPAQQEQVRRNSIWVSAIAVIAIVIIVTAFTSMRRSDTPLHADRAQRGPVVASISTNGKIEAADNFEAHAPAPAVVKKVLVKEGDAVKAGQLLLQLDDSQARAQAARAQAQIKAADAMIHAVQSGGTQEEVFSTQAELNKAQAELADSKRNLTALQKLQTTGAASAAEVTAAQERVNRAQTDVNLLQQKRTQRFSAQEAEQAQAQRTQAQAEYNAAQELLSTSNVRAPRAGTVYSLPVKQGAYVNGGDLLVQVADLHRVVVRGFVDEPDIGKLHLGEAVEVAWDAIPGRVWQGKITSIPSTVALRGTRTVGEVTAAVDNNDLRLLPNVNVTVQVVTARDDNALSVSREAIHVENGHSYVYEVVNDQLVRRDVETSISNLTRIEITKGLQDNALVAISTLNGQPLKPKMAVRVAEQ